ncbi:MAG: PAS domain S-box protein [Ignavibacteriales bacterium]|nr:MAG: PAS domain S-box protein [Ignavibacteriales bacterium]
MPAIQNLHRSCDIVQSEIIENAHLKFAWECIEDGVCFWDSNQIIQFVNQSFCNIFCKDKNDLLNHSVKDVFSSQPSLKKYLLKLDLNTTPSDSFHCAVLSNGKKLIIENFVYKQVFTNTDHFFCWIIKDKTDSIESVEKLKLENEELRISMNSIGDGVISTDYNGMVVRMNPEAERLTGWKINYAKGKHINEILLLQDSTTHSDIVFPIQKIINEKIKLNPSNHTLLIGKSNTRTHVSYTGCPIYDDSKFIKGSIIVIRDESENYRKAHLLKESEAKFSAVFKSKLAGITLSKFPSGTFIDVNDTFLSMTGFIRDEIIGYSAIDLGIWVNIQHRNEFIKKLSELGKVKNLEFEFRIKNGGLRIGQISSEIVDVGDEKLILTMINDVTDRIKTEFFLKTSQAQLETALELASLGHWEYDFNSDVLMLNDHFYKLLHTTIDNEVSYSMTFQQYLDRFVHPDDISSVKEQLQISSLNPDPNLVHEMTHRIIYADGNEGIILVKYFMLKDKLGSTLKSYGVNQDITKQKSAEQVLKNEKEQLNVTLKNIRDGVISTDIDDKIILINKAVTFITGYEQDELIGNSIIEFFEFLKADFTSLSGKSEYSTIFGMNFEDQNLTSEAIEIVSKTGDKKIIYCNSAQVKEVDGNLRGYVYVLKDITEQVKTETQLQLSQKMEAVGQLAAGIAHEINTPMQYIMDNTAFLKNSFSSLKEYIAFCEHTYQYCEEAFNEIQNKKDLLDIIYLLDEIPAAVEQTESGIHRVSNIVRAMKDFSHPGKKEMVLGNINNGIEVTATISKNEWKYIAELELDLDSNLPLVLCNIDEINQVILNLIVNAAQAINEKMINNKMSGKGKILIKTFQDADNINIEISDTGTGIPNEIKDKIFDPFFTTKEVGKGTGQGLSIVHNIIIKNHKGAITVESVLNSGTTFKVKLPVNKNP